MGKASRKKKNHSIDIAAQHPETALLPLDNSSNKTLLKNRLIHFALIFGVCLIAYSNTFNAPFILDDFTIVRTPFVVEPSLLFKNPDLANELVNIKVIAFLSRPVAFLSYALNYKLHEFDSAGFHVFNLLLHIINAFLVYMIALLVFNVQSLKDSNLYRRKELIALFSSLLFAAHPIQTQAVTYIVQRFTSLAALFYLLAFFMYLKYRFSISNNAQTESSPFADKKALLWYAGMIFMAVLGYKTKEITYTLPFSIILFDFIFFKARAGQRALIYTPLLLTLLVFPATLALIKNVSITKIGGDYTNLRAVGEYTDISRLDYLFTEFVVLVKYLRLIFLPIGQNVLHAQTIYNSFFNGAVIASFAFLSAFFAFGVYLVRIARGKTVLMPLALVGFGIFWFFITLSVESSIIPLYPIYEHRLYLPTAFFFISLATGLFWLYDRYSPNVPLKVVAASLVVIVCILSAATFERNTVWGSSKALWEDVKRKNPTDRLLLTLIQLSLAYMREGSYEDALREIKTALSMNPDKAEVYDVLGNIYLKMQKYDLAIEALKTALKISPQLPDSHLNLAEVYLKQGRIDLAVAHLENALQSLPTNPNIYQLLGFSYINMGRVDDALRLFQRGIELNPKEPVLYYNKGVAYASKGMFKEAVKLYKEAIALKPDYAEAYNNMGYAYAMAKNYDEAIGAFNKALQYKSPYPEAERNRSLAMQLKGAK